MVPVPPPPPIAPPGSVVKRTMDSPAPVLLPMFVAAIEIVPVPNAPRFSPAKVSVWLLAVADAPRTLICAVPFTVSPPKVSDVLTVALPRRFRVPRLMVRAALPLVRATNVVVLSKVSALFPVTLKPVAPVALPVPMVAGFQFPSGLR